MAAEGVHETKRGCVTDQPQHWRTRETSEFLARRLLRTLLRLAFSTVGLRSRHG